MALTSRFYNSVNGDRRYSASDFAELFGSLVRNGVFPVPTNSMQVIAGNGLSLRIRAGRCWINGYIGINDSSENIQIPVASANLPRKDLVVIRWSATARAMSFNVKQGIPAQDPVNPGLTRNDSIYELGIAEIHVNPNTTNISNSDITDLRIRSEYCGLVKGVLENIEADGLFTQLESRFNEWFDGIRGQVSTNVEIELRNRITTLDSTKVNITDFVTPTTGGILRSEDFALFRNSSDLVNNQLRDYSTTVTVPYQTLGLQSGITAYSAAQAPIVRKIGKFVELTGSVTGITGLNNLVAVLGSEYRPPRDIYFTGVTSTQGGVARFIRWNLGANGELRNGATTDGQYALSGTPLFSFHIIYDTEEVF